MSRFFSYFAFLFIFLTSVARADSLLPIKEVTYSYGENHKAWMLLPSVNVDVAPIIIFNYHEDVDRSKTVRIRREVQDFYRFMDQFYQWGAITIVPQRRDIDLDAIVSAIRYARNLKYGDKNRIYVIGYSEAALLSLLAVSQFPSVKGLVMVTPRNIHESGAFSLPQVMRAMPKIRVPILEISSRGLESGVVHLGHVYREAFTQQKKNLIYKEYDEIERWFWNPENDFMYDIKSFVLDDYFDDIPVKPENSLGKPLKPVTNPPPSPSKPIQDKPLYFPFGARSV